MTAANFNIVDTVLLKYIYTGDVRMVSVLLQILKVTGIRNCATTSNYNQFQNCIKKYTKGKLTAVFKC